MSALEPSREQLNAANGVQLSLQRWIPPGGVAIPAPIQASQPVSPTFAPDAERQLGPDRDPSHERPTQPTSATIVLVHGFGEHQGRYGRLVRGLLDHGYGVVTYDQRGHGLSGGQRGHIDHFVRFVVDLDQVIATTEPPRYLLGHSFGGLVALRYTRHFGAKLAGLVLSSPLFGVTVPVPRWKHYVGRLMNRLAPSFTLDSGVDPATLSHDPAVIAQLATDRLAHTRVSARFYAELTRALARVDADAAHCHLPSLTLQAGDDRVVSAAAARRVTARLPQGTYLEYSGLYHEIFNELAVDQVFADLIDWIGHQSAAQSA